MKHSGFTLIELLVSIGIMLIMFALGLVNYFNFRDQQKIKQAQNSVKEAVIDAQNAARSGRLRGCNQLRFYQISFSSNELKLKPYCMDTNFDGSPIYGEELTYQLPEGVTFVTPLTLYAQAINGLIDDDTDIHTQNNNNFDLTVQLDPGTSATLCIDKSGTISEGTCP
jgi:prepilin-type N-terminal cleavage/methylation domain-containing protein